MPMTRLPGDATPPLSTLIERSARPLHLHVSQGASKVLFSPSVLSQN